jgi:hypothetical protein
MKFGDVFQGTQFNGLVTFTAINSELQKSSGSAITEIHGGNIKTGTITANKITSTLDGTYTNREFVCNGTMGGYNGATIGWNPNSGCSAGVIGAGNAFGIAGLGFNSGTGGFFGRVTALPSSGSCGSYTNTVVLSTPSHAMEASGSATISGNLTVKNQSVVRVSSFSAGTLYLEGG